MPIARGLLLLIRGGAAHSSALRPIIQQRFSRYKRLQVWDEVRERARGPFPTRTSPVDESFK